MGKLLTIALTFALAGCVSDKELAARDRDTCAMYGFSQMDQRYGECMLTLARARAAKSAERNAALYAIGEGLEEAGQAARGGAGRTLVCENARIDREASKLRCE